MMFSKFFETNFSCLRYSKSYNQDYQSKHNKNSGENKQIDFKTYYKDKKSKDDYDNTDFPKILINFFHFFLPVLPSFSIEEL